MTEQYGNLPDAFFLSQSEIENLRNAKKELTTYGREKLKELIEKQKKEDTWRTGTRALENGCPLLYNMRNQRNHYGRQILSRFYV